MSPRVLDAIVDHLNIVARAGRANPLAARLGAVARLGRDALKDLLDVRPRVRRAAGHDGRPVARALLAARDAGANKEALLRLEVLGAADRVGKEGVACARREKRGALATMKARRALIKRPTSVDDDVALLGVRQNLLDKVVDGRAGLDEQHDATRLLEAAH